jgi:hypothetical protein
MIGKSEGPQQGNEDNEDGEKPLDRPQFLLHLLRTQIRDENALGAEFKKEVHPVRVAHLDFPP